MYHLSQNLGQRVAGTTGEIEARNYIVQSFETLGYQPEVQPFTYQRGNVVYDSANVTAVKEGKLKKELIIGAHYDAVRGVQGVDDNATGIGVILEVAERIKDLDTPYTIRFIAFGAEEVGLKGSSAYAKKMTNKDINNTVAMINLDSLAVGDFKYVYGSSGKDGWLREFSLDIAEELSLDIQTNPGLNPEYPKGTTGDWSDHAPFKAIGIPFAYFEATNWEIGDMDGYTQTVKHGAIWHNPGKDNLAFIEREFPGRTKEHLRSFSHILTELTLTLKQNTRAQYMSQLK
jgi:alkaline phosphatase isozyme conversion protein